MVMTGFEEANVGVESILAGVSKDATTLIGDVFNTDVRWWTWALSHKWLRAGGKLYFPVFSQVERPAVRH